jgi:protein-S-isoprenylcysteine O-methyltransferase Ste14
MKALQLKIPPLGVFLLAGLAMWGISTGLPAAAGGFPGRLVLAGALFAAGGIFGIGGVVAFRRRQTTVDPIKPDKASTLVTTGCYQYSRNPMYLGLALVLAAWAVYLANLVALLVLPAFIAYMTRFQIKPEERALLDKFGAEFALYMSRVRRWL